EEHEERKGSRRRAFEPQIVKMNADLVRRVFSYSGIQVFRKGLVLGRRWPSTVRTLEANLTRRLISKDPLPCHSYSLTEPSNSQVCKCPLSDACCRGKRT